LLKAIRGAKHSIEVVIFRFEQKEIERALTEAVGRGVAVHALIAHTNRSGEERLRKLEMRLLAAGVTVARTADDLMRYHAKFMIVDSRELYLLAYNFTYADIDHSRSFGVVSRTPALVREAARLFEADKKRQQFEPDQLAVSPLNARKLLGAFIKAARKELLIYDPKVSDVSMLRLIAERSAAGVDVRLIGRTTRKIPGMQACGLPQMRLHTRAMVRDGRTAFVGSQSLRPLELDGRREAGIIFKDAKAVAKIRETFLADWGLAKDVAEEGTGDAEPAAKVAKKVAKLLAKDLPLVAPVINGAVREIAGDANAGLDPERVEGIVKGAVKAAVKEAVNDMLEEAVEGSSGGE